MFLLNLIKIILLNPEIRVEIFLFRYQYSLHKKNYRGFFHLNPHVSWVVKTSDREHNFIVDSLKSRKLRIKMADTGDNAPRRGGFGRGRGRG